jgi:hypothetical protein
VVHRLRGGGDTNNTVPEWMVSGLAAGGQISQKIYRDPHPAWVYDTNRVARFHLTIMNAAQLTQVTGLPAPPTPVSPQKYLELGLPWFSVYDEHMPMANSFTPPSALANVQSIGQIECQRLAGQPQCSYCQYQLATLKFSPCGHFFCNECANASKCPSCKTTVTNHLLIAAPMPMPGREDEDGVDAQFFDKRVIKLQVGAALGKVYSFRLDEDEVTAPSGPIPKPTRFPGLV